MLLKIVWWKQLCEASILAVPVESSRRRQSTALLKCMHAHLPHESKSNLKSLQDWNSGTDALKRVGKGSGLLGGRGCKWLVGKWWISNHSFDECFWIVDDSILNFIETKLRMRWNLEAWTCAELQSITQSSFLWAEHAAFCQTIMFLNMFEVETQWSVLGWGYLQMRCWRTRWTVIYTHSGERRPRSLWPFWPTSYIRPTPPSKPPPTYSHTPDC